MAEIELICEPSTALLDRLEGGQIDLALVTRYPHQPFAVLRKERFVWAASAEHEPWLRDPLPVALFEADDIARRYAVEALQATDRDYRLVCSSRSLHGLIAVAQAGLAVIGLAESSVPQTLKHVGLQEGLPSVPMFDLSLISAPMEMAKPALALRDFLSVHLANREAID